MFNSDVAPKALLLNDSYVVALHIAAESLR